MAGLTRTDSDENSLPGPFADAASTAAGLLAAEDSVGGGLASSQAGKGPDAGRAGT